MNESGEHRVELHLIRGYEFSATFENSENPTPMVLDEPPPLGEGAGPGAADLLAAAVGNCLAASFLFCLRKTRLDAANLTASVNAHVVRNEHGRFRISVIDVELAPELRDKDEARFARCERLFEDFCTVTESVRRGITVNVRIGAPAGSTQQPPARTGASPTR